MADLAYDAGVYYDGSENMEEELRLYDCGCMAYRDPFYDTEYCATAEALDSRQYDATVAGNWEALRRAEAALSDHLTAQYRAGSYRDVPWNEVFA